MPGLIEMHAPVAGLRRKLNRIWLAYGITSVQSASDAYGARMKGIDRRGHAAILACFPAGRLMARIYYAGGRRSRR
jgi:hypothetical protein